LHLLYTDEVNVDPEKSEFFVYAGVAIPGENAAALSADIEALRKRNGYKPGDVLKFNTVERPAHIQPAQHQNAKRELMEAAAKHGVKLLASFLLHNIVKDGDVDQARRNEINRVSFHFNAWLQRVNDCGLVLIDTFTDANLTNHLREKFAIGVTGNLPFSKLLPLDRILGYHLASIGTSHFTSVIDVVLGGLRYAVNGRKEDRPVCKTLIRQLAPLCIAEGLKGNKASELSINWSPKGIKHPPYLAQYRELCAFLRENGIDPAQEPSGAL